MLTVTLDGYRLGVFSSWEEADAYIAETIRAADAAATAGDYVIVRGRPSAEFGPAGQVGMLADLWWSARREFGIEGADINVTGWIPASVGGDSWIGVPDA